MLGTGTLQGEPPAHRPRDRHPDPGMDPGRWPPAPGMARWPGTGGPGLSRGDSLHPDLWLPGRHSAWFPNKYVQQPVIISPGRHPGALGEGCSCTPPPPPCLLCPPQGMQGVQGRGSNLLSSVPHKSSKVLKLHEKGRGWAGPGGTLQAPYGKKGSVETKHSPGLLPPTTSNSSN